MSRGTGAAAGSLAEVAEPNRRPATGGPSLAGLRAMAHLGPRTAGLVALHSARRHVEERRLARSPRPPGAATGPGPLLAGPPIADGPTAVRFRFERAELSVWFRAPDTVTVTWRWAGEDPPAPSYALVATPDLPPVADLAVTGDDQGGWVVRSGALAVTVAPDGALAFAPPAGPVLRHHGPPTRVGGGWRLPFTVRPGERLTGLGEQASGIDRRGERHVLWNRDPGGSWSPGRDPLYLGVPVLVGTHPDGDVLVFHDNPTRAVFDLGPPDDADRAATATATFAGGQACCHVVVGDPPRLLDRYTALTGRPALPPRWALGYHQSRWGYRAEGDVRAVADGFAAERLPLSAVHLDIDWMDGYRVFTVDRRRFPDMAALAEELGRRGTRLVAIVDPAVKVDRRFPLYREARRLGLLCTDRTGHPVVGVVWPGHAAFPDFTDPRARHWWADRYRALADLGVAGFWHDMNEPTSITVGSDPTLPAGTRHDLDGHGGDHGDAHNVYGHCMNRAGYDGARRARPGSRPFVLTRSGWAGTQRYAWAWTGDAETSWPSLRQQVATVLGLGLSGIPFCGPDVGGFSGAPDPELYLRWLQLAVFLPLCRTHSIVGAPGREPWRWPEPVRTLVGDAIRFRYRLLPHLYTLAHQSAATGAPPARPLWWPSPGHGDGNRGHAAADAPAAAPAGDGRVGPGRGMPSHADDAFLLGDALLVAPVHVPGADRRSVPLPAGRWASLWGDPPGALPGGAHRSLPAPLGRVPVLARLGSVVALDDGWADPAGACRVDGDPPPPGARARSRRAGQGPAPDHAPRLLAFHCWPDGPDGARGVAVDDAGDGHGPVRRDELTVSGPDGGEATVRWDRRGGFAPPPRVRVVLHGFVVGSARADGRDVPVRGGTLECPAFDELRLHDVRPAERDLRP